MLFPFMFSHEPQSLLWRLTERRIFMKKSPLELKLEAQEMLRLQMLEQATEDGERKKLLSEIEALNRMRDGMEGRRTDSRSGWIKTIIQTGVPLLATMFFAVCGFASEQLNGNPTGFTLRWLFNRAPR